MKKLKVPNGLRYGFDSNNNKICVGAQMGRRDSLPESPNQPIKLRLVKLRMSSCGAYDEGGCYWGIGSPLYWATDEGEVSLWVRATSRFIAKAKIIGMLPNARFYN